MLTEGCGTNRDLHWVIEILGSSRLGINWLDFNWGRCGCMMGDFVGGEVLLFYYWNLVVLFQWVYLLGLWALYRDVKLNCILYSLGSGIVWLYWHVGQHVIKKRTDLCFVMYDFQTDGLTDTNWNIGPLYSSISIWFFASCCFLLQIWLTPNTAFCLSRLTSYHVYSLGPN